MADLNKVKLGTKGFEWETVNNVLRNNLESQGSSCEKVGKAFKLLEESGLYSYEKDYERIKVMIADAIQSDREDLIFLERLLQDPRLVFVEHNKWPEQINPQKG